MVQTLMRSITGFPCYTATGDLTTLMDPGSWSFSSRMPFGSGLFPCPVLLLSLWYLPIFPGVLVSSLLFLHNVCSSLSLAQKILYDNLLSDFNLQGIALGKPLISPRHQLIYSEFLQANGYLSRDQIVRLQTFEDASMKLVKEGKSKPALTLITTL